MTCAVAVAPARYLARVDSNTVTRLTQKQREALNRNVRLLCEKHHISLNELAREAGLSSVRTLLGRGSGRAATLMAIANVLKVSVDDLVSAELREEERPLHHELKRMLDSATTPGPIEDDELAFLRNINPPDGREMTANAYLKALEMYRATKAAE